MAALFTIKCHHRDISVMFVTQNVFMPGRWSKMVNLNSHIVVLFKNRRDASQIKMLAHQIMPGHTSYFISAYEMATNMYGYLLVDLSPHANDEYKHFPW